MLIRPPTSFTLFPYTTLFRSSFDLIALRTRCTRDTRPVARLERRERLGEVSCPRPVCVRGVRRIEALVLDHRSEEHTSELQSHHDLVCRLLLEKKKQNTKTHY